MNAPAEITSLLSSWRRGDEEALDPLMSAVYRELRRLAASRLRGERRHHTLQPTELVHEAFLRLVDSDVTWQDRTHFYSLAVRVMRRILVDHARSRGARKRGGDRLRVTLDEGIPGSGAPSCDLLALDQALERLEEVDPDQARMLELYYFAGSTLEEIGEVAECSAATVHRRLASGKAFLSRELHRTVEDAVSDA